METGQSMKATLTYKGVRYTVVYSIQESSIMNHYEIQIEKVITPEGANIESILTDQEHAELLKMLEQGEFRRFERREERV